MAGCVLNRVAAALEKLPSMATARYLKLGVQVADLYAPNRLRRRVEQSLAAKNNLLTHLYGKEPVSVDAVVSGLEEPARRLRPLVCDTTSLLHDALGAGRRILLEGQLGALRDPDHGIYPYPTSSSPLAGFAAVGAGIPARAISRVVAVTKAYSSCVGAGPFVTEIPGLAAGELRERGGDSGEFGATTGRPRRMGWFDAVATRYGCLVQGATEIALTNMDVLGYLEEIPICVAYDVDGERTRSFPVPAQLDKARPVYERHPGWLCDIRGAGSFEALPPAAQRYIQRIESLIGVPVRWASVGPHRDEMVRIGP
jgi:adenylosuccinate synthase